MGSIDAMLFGFISFAKGVKGICITPYQSMRRIVESGSAWELLYIGILLLGYFSLASAVRVAAFRPFLLTKQVFTLASATAMNYLFMSAGLYFIATRFGGTGPYRSFAVAWGYTLIPTVCWFFLTSVLYVVLPPPRTPSVAGVAFSLVFLSVSAVLLTWKLMLSYLVLRFGAKLDLLRISATALVFAPFLGAYSVAMYRLGIFRVPFI